MGSNPTHSAIRKSPKTQVFWGFLYFVKERHLRANSGKDGVEEYVLRMA